MLLARPHPSANLLQFIAQRALLVSALGVSHSSAVNHGIMAHLRVLLCALMLKPVADVLQGWPGPLTTRISLQQR